MQENLCNATAICCNCSMFSHDCLYIPAVHGAAVHGNVKNRKTGQYVC